MFCNICDNKMELVFNSRILHKYDVDYYSCGVCHFLCTEKPYWLDEAYSSSINLQDTGLIGRNIKLSKISSVYTYFCADHLKCLDYGGGYGIFTRMMRDIGFDFYWFDPFTPNLFARGFEYHVDTAKTEPKSKFGVLTSFEAFEHFTKPTEELEKMSVLSDNILFTTQLFKAGKIPELDEWWYYGREHGQHIAFYTQETLKIWGHKHGFQLYSNGRDTHLFSKDDNSRLFLKLIFILFHNNIISKLCREVIYRYIKFRKKSRTQNDMINLAKQND